MPAHVFVLVLPIAVLLVLGYENRWTSDDSFIDFRIVQQLLAGHGPVYNVGQRVEAYTSPLWLSLLALAAALGARVEGAAVALGIVFSVGGLALAERGAFLLLPAHRAPAAQRGAVLVVPLGAAVFAAIPAVWDFVTSGLETGLIFGWLGLAFWLLARQVRRESGAVPGEPIRRGFGATRLLAAFVIGLGPLVRPDLALVSLPLLGALVVGRSDAAGKASTLGRWLAVLFAAGALPVAYEVFRAGYFAAWEPNTALAKEASGGYVRQGVAYLRDFGATYALWLPFVLLAGWWIAEMRQRWVAACWSELAVWVAPVVGGLADVAYVVRVGGDFMHGRMLLPGVLSCVLPLAVVGIPLTEKHRWWYGSVAAAIAVWCVVCGLFLRVPYPGGISADGIADERGIYAAASGIANPVSIADHAKDPRTEDGAAIHARAMKGPPAFIVPGDAPSGMRNRAVPLPPRLAPQINLVVDRDAIGLRGYSAGLTVFLFDRHGLTDPIAARFRLEQRVGRPGHEKETDYGWIVALFSNPTSDLTNPDVAAARAALGCGALRDLLHAVEDPLTPGRFLRNVELAGELTALRVPAVPAVAQHELCGTP
jgi:arabinofuranosyltransferase